MNKLRDIFKKVYKSETKAKKGNPVFERFASIPEVPVIKEVSNRDYVFYGEDNLYPQKLSDMPYGSAIHNSILKTKTKMTHGDGFLFNDALTEQGNQEVINGLPASDKSELLRLLENKYGGETLFSVIKRASQDIQKLGAIAIEVVYNTDHTKISFCKRVKVENVRCGKKENGKVTKYFYSEDWSDKKCKAREIKAFDPNDKESYNQIIYLKVGDLDYYGEPPYIGAITWIKTDFQMGIYHLSNIENGMNPSIKLQFYKLPANETDKQQILDDVRRNFVGPKKTGKHMVFFSDGKELAPLIEPIDVNNLDKQLINLAELCDRKILTGHQLTSPLLVGISTPGQLGGNTELMDAYKIFDSVVIESDRQVVITAAQMIFNTNKVPVTIGIDPFDPFKEKTNRKKESTVLDAINAMSPIVAAKVLENLTQEEIRGLAGIKPTANA